MTQLSFLDTLFPPTPTFEPIRVISLHEPYAWAMREGHKSNETRTWPVHFRGVVAIHAAKEPFRPSNYRTSFLDLLDRCHFTPEQLLYRHIVAIGELVDCVRAEDIRDTLTATERGFGDYSDGRWIHVYRNVQPLLRPTFALGGQRWWWWTPTNADQLEFRDMIVTRAAGYGSV